MVAFRLEASRRHRHLSSYYNNFLLFLFFYKKYKAFFMFSIYISSFDVFHLKITCTTAEGSWSFVSNKKKLVHPSIFCLVCTYNCVYWFVCSYIVSHVPPKKRISHQNINSAHVHVRSLFLCCISHFHCGWSSRFFSGRCIAKNNTKFIWYVNSEYTMWKGKVSERLNNEF